MIKKVWLAIKERGLRYVYNLWWLDTFYRCKGFLHDLLYLKIYPLFNYAPFPSAIEIEASTRCNLKCLICEHTYWSQPSQDMNFEQVRGIIEQFPRLKFIAFTGIGENFLNKDFLKMYEYLKETRPWVFIELYDNFYFIDEEKAGKLLDLGIGKVIASVDSATKETYEKIRVGSDFNRVINNVKGFFELKRKKEKFFPIIVFHYIVNKLNIHEMVQYVEMVKDLGGDHIFFTRMLHAFAEVAGLAVDIPEELKQKVNQKGKELNIRISWNDDTRRKKLPISHCNFWIMPFVYVTGDVVPCCAMNEANIRQFQIENSLGNVFKSSFRDIWFGPKFKEFRKNLRRGTVHPLCRDCPIFDIKNAK